MTLARLSALSLLLSVAATAASGDIFRLRAHSIESNKSNSKDNDEHPQSVLCRMIAVTSSFRMQGSDKIGRREETLACVPIVDGQETDQEHAITLPTDIHEQNLADIRQGRLLVEINGAQLVDEKLDLGDSPKFEVINDPDHPARRQLQGYGFTVGDKTIAIVRIHTNDASPDKSLNELENVYLKRSISMRSQFRACSFDQVDFSLAAQNGKLDVRVDASVYDYDSAGQLWTDANKKLKEELGVNTPEIADRVIFCMPPNEEWDLAAAASVNHWKVVMANQYCTSLSGIMHELGHSMGLLHANEDGVEYGDVTGYMGYGQPEEDGPLKCFNAQNHDQFGWFADRTFNWDWSMQPQIVSLAAFVDYDLTGNNEYVIASLDDKYFLQYNSASKFNSGTNEFANEVVVVEKLPEGAKPGGTNLVGTIRESNAIAARKLEIRNYLGSGRALVLEVCERVDGAHSSDPNMMVLSVGMDTSLCEDNDGNGGNNGEDEGNNPLARAQEVGNGDNPCSGYGPLRAFFCRRGS